ncbi:phosphatidylinositol mannoside acyltransferase [Nocardiopsis potens]|uniref:phosphatidylinositol mannoside acyltransferase n=1 Tax=Nocardiopsis potens TaxID=1246458 RepID=UPI000344C669|nr:phosphatidylinositol mannoside acyltransferase [Nocardiopsis potens]
MGDRTAAAAYAAGWRLVRELPEKPGRAAFRSMADTAWRRRGPGVLRLEANLRRVAGPGVTAPQLRALSRAGMRSYLRYYYEMFRLPAIDAATLDARTRATGVEALEAHVRSGRGVVAALPHMGNWDHAGAWITLRGVPLTTVAERLRPPEVFDRFVDFRTGLGMEVLPLTPAEDAAGAAGASGAGIAGRLARRLREGRLVCLLADRDLTAGGVDVEFFGEAARMPAGPAALAERTGAALMPVSLWYDGPLLRIEVHDEIPVPDLADRRDRVRAMTQGLAGVFQDRIAEHPEDWHMLQRVFTADLAAPPPGAYAPEAAPPADSVDAAAGGGVGQGR